MAYLMDSNAMRICVRPRPWHPEKELPFLAQDVDQPFFLGGGNFGTIKKATAGPGSLREIVEVIDNRSLDFDRKPEGSDAKRYGTGARRYKDRRYVFDHVFKMTAAQEDVYENTAKPLLDGVLKGYNATVFAYGATGCGKTHTISGTQEDPGIIVKTMRDLFERIDDTNDEFETHIELSMIEIYKENIRDLLSDNFPEMPTGGLKLLENEKDRVTIADVTIRTPRTANEVMELVFLGNERRSTSFTTANSVSSRSHAVLQINVGRKSRRADVDMDKEAVFADTTSATLSIVDLAGSERASATRNMGERMKEGALINKSLLALSSCISALCDAQRKGARPHVPYRNSKLTRLLKFSLGGNCRTVMIVCVSPSSKDMEDTANTLTWADRAKHVKTTITRNVAGHHVSARQYLEKIHELSERNKLLEVQLLAKNAEASKLQQLKVEENRRKVAELLQISEAQIRDGLDSIKEGAEHRAMWDVGELAVKSLQMRCEDIDEDVLAVNVDREKEICQEIIALQLKTYQDNVSVQAKVRREAEITTAIEEQLKQTESRAFPDLDPLSLENLRLQIKVQRSRVAEAIHEGRLAGYRDRASAHQDALARAAIAAARSDLSAKKLLDKLRRLCETSTVTVETVQTAIAVFEAYAKDNQKEFDDIFQNVTRNDVQQAGPLRTPLRGVKLRPAATPAEPKQQISPSLGRLKSASEKKGGYPAKLSPRKPTIMRTQRRVSSAPRARFADDEGQGLQTVHTFRPRSSQSPSIVIDKDDPDWEEVHDIAKPLPKPSSMKESGKAFGLGRPSRPSILQAFPVGQAAAASTSTASPTPASSSSDIPAWKVNRLLMGKTGTPNGSTGTPNANSSMANTTLDSAAGDTSLSSDISMSFKSLGIGKPSRPLSRPSSAAGGPLGELRQVPPRPASSLTQPTAASAARAADKGENSPTLDTSPTEPQRRRLSLRHERPKLHKAAVPYSRKSSMLPSPPKHSMIPSPISSPAGENGPSPRGSTLRASTSMAVRKDQRLRHSMSMSLGPGARPLNPRPSMMALGASGLGAGSVGVPPRWR